MCHTTTSSAAPSWIALPKYLEHSGLTEGRFASLKQRELICGVHYEVWAKTTMINVPAMDAFFSEGGPKSSRSHRMGEAAAIDPHSQSLRRAPRGATQTLSLPANYRHSATPSAIGDGE